jgi:DNA-binding FadR family transcriptional regulator
MLIQMSKALGALLRTSFEISTRKQDGPKSSLSMHREVLDAVIAKQPDRAEKATLKLIDGARDDIQLVLETRKRLPKITRPAAQLKAA